MPPILPAQPLPDHQPGRPRRGDRPRRRDGHLRALAEEGHNARLVAPRRYGKTSLLRRVQSELSHRDWVTVYVDLLGIVTLEDFSARIERAYSTALTGRLAQWFTALRRTLRPSITAGGGPVPASASVELSAQSRHSLEARLDLPVKVHEKTLSRVHIVFDEFQELDSIEGQPDAITRSVIQHHTPSPTTSRAASTL